MPRIHARGSGRFPRGALTPRFAAGFTVAMSTIFLLAAWRLNRLTLILAPVVLAVLFFYSYKALHTLVASFSRAGAGPRADGSVDCHPRLA